MTGKIVSFTWFDKVIHGLVTKSEGPHITVKCLGGLVVKTTVNHVKLRKF